MTLTVILAAGRPVTAACPYDCPGFGARCDMDEDGFITVDEVQACASDSFTEMAGGEEYLTREQFDAAMPQAEDVGITFSEVDADDDGQISLEEWLSYRSQNFLEATEGVQDEVPALEYEQ